MNKEKQFSREIHNMTDTRLYNVWNNIKRRCYTKTNPSYKYYGGCGVKMCEEWRKSYKAEKPMHLCSECEIKFNEFWENKND